MADIKIEDIQFTGNDFFSDSETFMNDLSDDEMGIKGGDWSMGSDSCGTVAENEWSMWSNSCRLAIVE
jgi:hypothetical protein